MHTLQDLGVQSPADFTKKVANISTKLDTISDELYSLEDYIADTRNAEINTLERLGYAS